jgi:hypothetical protein
VLELGRLTGTPTPHIDSVYALVKLLADRRAGRPAVAASLVDCGAGAAAADATAAAAVCGLSPLP